ncbi:MAG TPA: helix-turn-helix domain-containing protein, partial [Mycobacterium sp.]|nr:helix-turn-helix domain-containing protein [Mycobacterium sp.]
MTSLRERKRLRTRQALVDAAAELFEQRGYDGTTIADIAAAADISTRTFFSYFASKEDILFPDADARVKAALTAID